MLPDLLLVAGKGKRRQFSDTWGFLGSGAVVVLPIGHEDLPGLEALMYQYWDRPMVSRMPRWSSSRSSRSRS